MKMSVLLTAAVVLAGSLPAFAHTCVKSGRWKTFTYDNPDKTPVIFGGWSRSEGEILLCSLYGLVSVYADLLLISGHMLKLNLAVYESIQGVIAAQANARAGMDLGAALSDDDVASQNGLAVSTLYAKALGLAVTTVFGRTYALFVSKELQTESQHSQVPPYQNTILNNQLFYFFNAEKVIILFNEIV